MIMLMKLHEELFQTQNTFENSIMIKDIIFYTLCYY